tara:strand:+ start:99 stop:422 length:324 start_codon:yes stop_codon:yes gene_type:complete
MASPQERHLPYADGNANMRKRPMASSGKKFIPTTGSNATTDMSNKPKNIDAFRSKTSNNGSVNDNGTNPFLKFFEKRLSNPKNVAPAAKYIQKKKQRNKMIQDLLNE